MNKFNQSADNTDTSISIISNEYGRYNKMYYKNAVPDSRVLVFLTGFCLGMVFFYLSGTRLISEGRLPAALSMDNISRIHDFDFYAAGLFEYVASERLGQLLFMVICATSFMRVVFSYAILGWGGFELGIMMFTLVYQYGLKGLLLSVMFLIPHGIFFLVVFILLFNKYWLGDKKSYHNYDSITENELHNKFTKIKKAVIIILLWFIGILSEVYINPEIIKKIALFFK